MTTARTQKFHAARGGAARPLDAQPKPDDYVPVSAEAFIPEDGEFDPLGELPATEVGLVEGAFDPSTLDFDPADHNVDDVKAYVEAHPEAAEAILELEENGKQRSGVMSFIENFDAEDEG